MSKRAGQTTEQLEKTRRFIQMRIDEMRKYDLEQDLEAIKEIDTLLAKRKGERCSCGELKVNEFFCETCEEDHLNFLADLNS